MRRALLVFGIVAQCLVLSSAMVSAFDDPIVYCSMRCPGEEVPRSCQCNTGTGCSCTSTDTKCTASCSTGGCNDTAECPPEIGI